ncbi:hypothetical protein SLA2020_357530 [Shorea laevis]
MFRSLSHERHLHHHLKTLATATTIKPPFHPLPFSPIHTLSTSAFPSSSTDAELRKHLGYTAPLLFCGAATYYSFPFPENAKHKRPRFSATLHCRMTFTLS